MLPGGYAVLIIAADGTVTHARAENGYRADLRLDSLVNSNIYQYLKNNEILQSAIERVIASGVPLTVEAILHDHPAPRVVRITPCADLHGHPAPIVMAVVWKQRIRRDSRQKVIVGLSWEKKSEGL